MKDNHLTKIKFSSLNIDPLIIKGINDLNFKFCTPIQSESLPIALQGKDVAGQAQTGTGKTAAFLISAIQRIIENDSSGKEKKQPRIFVLAPTRELAIQIAKDAEAIGRHTNLKIGLAYGGTDYEKQSSTITKGIDILIGTPGRVIDYYKNKIFKLNDIEVLVLDEADRMFDLGFSATLSHRVLELAYEHMNDPELIKIEAENMTADNIRQAIFFPSNEEKIPLLIGLIKEMEKSKVMIFVNTKKEVERLESIMKRNKIDAESISGDVPQKKRVKMLKRFEEGQLSVLIATDVASRGLHISDIKYVINYDLPQDAEDYVHRIGRTARAGTNGNAISFGCETYAISLPEIENYIDMKIPVANFNSSSLPEII